MRRWRFLIALAAIILIVAILFLVLRNRLLAEDYGPLVALCPGPDHYGYICESGTAVAYINALNDTRLYALDGVTEIKLPFPFTFYGTTYNEVVASSNGNLQFGNNNPAYVNRCLDEAPASDMGDMIAPYWDDLDLRAFGYLETEVVGEEPNRIFVVEWDSVPRFETGEPVTFEVQLFEDSNDIVFLYQNVTQSEGDNGRKATIGIQSEEQGLALQFGCNLPVISNAFQLQFSHPENPNGDVGLTAVPALPQRSSSVNVKGDAADLLRQLNLRGEVALADLQKAWLAQDPPLLTTWERLDVIGDGREELVILRQSTAQYPHLTQMMVVAAAESGGYELLLDQALSTRDQLLPKIAFEYAGDLTKDGQADLLLLAPESGHLRLLTAVHGPLELLAIPLQCTGSLAVIDGDIVRDNCTGDGRVITSWNGLDFANHR